MSENVRVDSWHSKREFGKKWKRDLNLLAARLTMKYPENTWDSKREFGKKWKRDLNLLAARLTMKYPENTLDNVGRYEHFANDEERVSVLKKVKHLMRLRQLND